MIEFVLGGFSAIYEGSVDRWRDLETLGVSFGVLSAFPYSVQR